MSDQNDDGIPEYKVVMIGDAFVGKTCIIKRFSDSYFSDQEQPTIAASYLQIGMRSGEKEIKLNLWDTAGDERFHCVVPLYARTAEAMIIVFDLSKPQTFENAKTWYQELINEVGKVPVVFLCGNKLDLVSEPIPADYEKWALENKLSYINTSALNGTNINELFQGITDQIVNTIVESDKINTIAVSSSTGSKKDCCK